MRRTVLRDAGVIALLGLLAVAGVALGQPAPNRIEAVERVAAACPGLIANDHAFTDAVASLLYAEDARWGRNGKRGNPDDLSHDAIAFRNPSSPFGVSIVDIIGGAGGPDPRVAWIDQTAETIRQGTRGVWVKPTGSLPPCLTGGPVPAPTPTPAPTPAPAVDLAPIVAALQRIEARLAVLEQRPTPAPVDLSAIDAYIDDMVGKGPEDHPDTPNHITDVKERIDANRAQLARILELVQRIANSRVLRF